MEGVWICGNVWLSACLVGTLRCKGDLKAKIRRGQGRERDLECKELAGMLRRLGLGGLQGNRIVIGIS